MSKGSAFRISRNCCQTSRIFAAPGCTGAFRAGVARYERRDRRWPSWHVCGFVIVGISLLLVLHGPRCIQWSCTASARHRRRRSCLFVGNASSFECASSESLPVVCTSLAVWAAVLGSFSPSHSHTVLDVSNILWGGVHRATILMHFPHT